MLEDMEPKHFTTVLSIEGPQLTGIVVREVNNVKAGEFKGAVLSECQQ